MDMKDNLKEDELRVLGCLIEKQLATPAYYPLTFNSLMNACNQRSNREPVSDYSDSEVRSALEGLMDKGFATRIRSAESRVDKFGHLAADALDISTHELAIMAELMLRGAQTPGELNQRAARMAPIETLQQVHVTLDSLMALGLVVRLERQPGRKEHRYAQRLGGEVSSGALDSDVSPAEGVPSGASGVGADSAASSDAGAGNNGPAIALEARVAALEAEVSRLRQELHELKRSGGQ